MKRIFEMFTSTLNSWLPSKLSLALGVLFCTVALVFSQTSTPERTPKTTTSTTSAPVDSSEEEDIMQSASLTRANLILPIDGDIFYDKDIKVLASLEGTAPQSALIQLDGWSYDKPVTIEEGYVSIEINDLKMGLHELSLILFNEKTEIVFQKNIRFFIRLPEPLKSLHKSPLRQFGRVIAKLDYKGGEASNRLISQSKLSLENGTLKMGKQDKPLSKDLDGGIETAYNLKVQRLEASGKILAKTDESPYRQPSDRMSGQIKYGPWVTARAGDIYPSYNELSLTGTRVRGAEASLNIFKDDSRWGSLQIVRGESRREITPYVAQYDTGNGSRNDTISGTYRQVLTAARLGFGGGEHFNLGFSFMKASDRVTSLDRALNDSLFGLRPVDNLVPGIDFRSGFWEGKIQVYSNWALSFYTKDASLGAFGKDSFDVSFSPKKFENIIQINPSTRGWQYFLSSKDSLGNSLNKSPDIAGFVRANSTYEMGTVVSIPLSNMVTETQILYNHLGLDYHSEGNPFLGSNPGNGLTLIQKLVLLQNQLSLGLEINAANQDLGFMQQNQRSYKLEVRYSPTPDQPGFWINGGRTKSDPNGNFPHQFSSDFINLNLGGYYQFLLPSGKLHTSMLYGFTQSDLELKDFPPDSTNKLLQFPLTRTHIITSSLQYKMRYSEFIPRISHSFSSNGIQKPTNTVNMGFMNSLMNNQLKMDASVSIGQYPASNTQSDLTVGESLGAGYYFTPNQNLRFKERWIKYGRNTNLILGSNYELYF